MNLLSELRNLFEPVLAAIAPDRSKLPDYLGMIRPTTNADHGDYQANFAMPLAKLLGKKPPELAQIIISSLPANDLVESAAVAGPGFINLRLKSEFLARSVQRMAGDAKLGVEPVSPPRTFVVDLSGPNVAKPLHVGHLRSTIIGDALVRLLRFLGHTVVGDNHLGDWGTQFGILLYGYKHHRDDAAFAADPVRELARLYLLVRQLAKVVGEDDEAGTGDVMAACREETSKLHAGDPENVELWKKFMPACLEMLRPVYEQLEVKIDSTLGESFYQPMLAGIVADLLAKGIAVESNGAVVIPNAKGIIPYSDDDHKKEEPPAIIRKRDGAFTYTTTDLATIQYRIQTWKPDVILYVVDARQALHFRTLFANAKRWGYANVEMHHIAFGSILGKDKKPYRTRDGGTIELETLLSEACLNAWNIYHINYDERKSHGHDVPDLTPETIVEISSVVGIGAVKYADLSGNRTSDYVFDLFKMCSTDGNTATYMQYAYARCRAIFRKGNIDDAAFRSTPPAVVITHNAERLLSLKLSQFDEALQAAAAEYLPHYITGYLWELAKAFSVFFENCPVLTAESDDLRNSRLLLVDLTGRVIRQALDLLGIKTVERM